jgi:hypothetical protein
MSGPPHAPHGFEAGNICSWIGFEHGRDTLEFFLVAPTNKTWIINDLI